MKTYIYKKWTFAILLNNLIFSGYLAYNKKLLFLTFDTNNFTFWNYARKSTKLYKIQKNIGILNFK
jgi:hypothetical protein